MSPKSSIYLVLLVAVVWIIAYDGNLDGGLDLFHEGERLSHFDAIAQGGLPFRDYYVPHGLGEDVIKPFLACKLFGVSVASVRRLGQNSFLYRGWLPPLGALSLLLAAASLLRSNRWTTLFAFLLTTGLLEISERYAFAFFAVGSVGMYLHSRKWLWLSAAGALSALALLYSTETGVYAVVAFSAWLVLNEGIGRSRNSFAAAIGGFACVFIPFLLWCAWKGIAGDFLQNLYIQIFLRREIWPSKYPAPHWLPAANTATNVRVFLSVLILFYLIPIVCIAGIVVGWLGKEVVVGLAGCVAGMFWLTVIGRPDRWHVAYAAGAVYLLVVVSAKMLAANISRKRVVDFVILVLMLAPLMLYGDGGMLRRKLTGGESPSVPPDLSPHAKDLRQSTLLRAGSIRIPSSQAQFLESLVGYIQENTGPSDAILDLTNQGLIYFLSNRRSPSRFHYLAHCDTPGLRKQFLAEIKNSRPALVLRPALQPMTQDELDQFVQSHYHRQTTIGSVEVFIR